MTRRPGLPALALVSLLSLSLSSPCAASVKPSSLAMGVGLGLGFGPGDHTAYAGVAPIVNVGWRVGSRLSLHSSLAYLREESEQPVYLRGLPATGDFRDLYGQSAGSPYDRSAHYVPFGIGLRLYLKQVPAGVAHGVFVEAAPTVSLAWLPLPYGYGGHDARLLRGARGTVGARFGSVAGAQGEIGVTYYSMERATTASPATRTYPPTYSSTRQFEFDALAVYVAFGFGD